MHYHHSLMGLVLAVCVLIFGGRSVGQESVRPSQSGLTASELRKPVATPQNYNLKLGPVIFDAGASVGFEYTDNVGISERDRESDFSFRPQVNLGLYWQATRYNTLRLTIGLGYAKYFNTSEADSTAILVDPGSEIAFDIYIANWRVSLHNRLAVLQNPVDDLALSNVARYDRIQNSIGITAVGDYNDLKVVLGYDFFNLWSMSDKFDFIDRAEHQVFGAVSLDVSPSHRVGFDLSTSIFDYDQGYNNDGHTFSGGPFWEMTLSNYLKVRLAGGGQFMLFGSGGDSGDNEDLKSWYFNAAISHRMNAYWTHSLAFGREGRLGLAVNYQIYDYIRYMTIWRINSKLSLSIEGFAEWADESETELGSEDSWRWGIALGTAWQINKRMNVGLGYRFTQKESDVEFRSYYQNTVTLTIGYDF